MGEDAPNDAFMLVVVMMMMTTNSLGPRCQIRTISPSGEKLGLHGGDWLNKYVKNGMSVEDERVLTSKVKHNADLVAPTWPCHAVLP